MPTTCSGARPSGHGAQEQCGCENARITEASLHVGDVELTPKPTVDAMPVNADTPSVEVILLSEQNDHINPAGAKGLGELGNVGTNAAVCNAIFHATGQRIRKPPCGWNSWRYRKRDRFAIFPSIPERP